MYIQRLRGLRVLVIGFGRDLRFHQGGEGVVGRSRGSEQDSVGVMSQIWQESLVIVGVSRGGSGVFFIIYLNCISCVTTVHGGSSGRKFRVHFLFLFFKLYIAWYLRT